jgi:hypothetical protein
MTSLVLGSALAFFSGVRSTNSFCRLPQVTGPLHSIRRARPLIVTCQRIIQASTLLKKPHMHRCSIVSLEFVFGLRVRGRSDFTVAFHGHDHDECAPCL